MVSALLLAGLFFKLGIEQRLREVGTLEALGFAARDIRKLFLIEGAILSVAGCVAGAAAAIAYGKLMLLGLRTIWSGAVGATPLVLHPDFQALALGSLGGIAAALACILWTLRGLRRITSRGLILGAAAIRPARSARIPMALALAGLALIAASASRAINQTAGFFGAGTLLLAAALWYGWIRLSRGSIGMLHDVTQLGSAQRRVEAGAQHPLRRAHRVGDVRRGRGGCISRGHWHVSCQTRSQWRLRADGGIAAAHRS